jgi:formylmethanofuran dehydrogenase subunit B
MKAVLAIIVCSLMTINVWAAKNPEVESCRLNIVNAAEVTLKISKEVPFKPFGVFVKTGGWWDLVKAVTKLGEGNPRAGGKKMLALTQPVFKKHKETIKKAAYACQGKCGAIRSLDEKCDEVIELSQLLNDLNLKTGMQLALAISSYGGTDGVKKTVKTEVGRYYKDRP